MIDVNLECDEGVVQSNEHYQCQIFCRIHTRSMVLCVFFCDLTFMKFIPLSHALFMFYHKMLSNCHWLLFLIFSGPVILISLCECCDQNLFSYKDTNIAICINNFVALLRNNQQCLQSIQSRLKTLKRIFLYSNGSQSLVCYILTSVQNIQCVISTMF